jgi:hypothetical protein
MLKEIRDITYHIYETVEGEKKERLITVKREEAEFWYNEGKIVYEWRECAVQGDWLTSYQQTVYVWH